MRAQDLRIGNWVQFRHTETPVLITLGDFVREYKEEHLEDYEPIQLTEEWLVKFGFKKTYSELTYKEYDFKKFGVEINSDIMTVSYNYGNNVEWVNFTHIKHVHILQNFYHALTGEELELKP